MPIILDIVGAKGGVGTSTFACAVALSAAERGNRVLIVGDSEDASAILGYASNAAGGDYQDGVAIADMIPEGTDADVIVCCGADHPDERLADHRILVTRGCYLALRRAVTRCDLLGTYDGFVLLNEPDRSLQQRDCEDVLGIPCLAATPVESSVSRVVDSGTFTTRATSMHETAGKVLLRVLGEGLSPELLTDDGDGEEAETATA